MQRLAFTKFKENLYIVCSGNLDISDKFTNVRALFVMFSKCCIQFDVFTEHLSIDKTILFFGRHSPKMNTLEKQIRFGYTFWTLCS